MSTTDATDDLSSIVDICKLSQFNNITSDQIVSVIMKLPCKHSQLDPLPTWLLKRCVWLLAPFLTVLNNSSLSQGAVSVE